MYCLSPPTYYNFYLICVICLSVYHLSIICLPSIIYHGSTYLVLISQSCTYHFCLSLSSLDHLFIFLSIIFFISIYHPSLYQVFSLLELWAFFLAGLSLQWHHILLKVSHKLPWNVAFSQHWWDSLELCFRGIHWIFLPWCLLNFNLLLITI